MVDNGRDEIRHCDGCRGGGNGNSGMMALVLVVFCVVMVTVMAVKAVMVMCFAVKLCSCSHQKNKRRKYSHLEESMHSFYESPLLHYLFCIPEK